MTKLQGKVALVTGGSAGLGLAMAMQFAKAGAFVYMTGRRQAELDAAVASLPSGLSAGVVADSSCVADLEGVIDYIKARQGGLDIVVANAGGGAPAPLAAISEEAVDQILGLNIKGTVFTVQKALPLLRRGGSIILIGSATSVQGVPGLSVYAAAKAAVRALARSWVLELKDRGVRVNVLSPGPTRTPGLLGLATADHLPALLDHMTSTIPLGRLGEADEIAQVALFLASEASSFVNGVELFADGGQSQV